MAKQRNIKIVYQVDASQVKAAQQTLGQAKAATDQLKNSTKQLGDQSKQTGTQYKLSIHDVIGEMNLLKQKIMETATTDKARLNELIPKYRELKTQVDQFNKSLDSTAKGSAAVGVSLGGIYNAVRIALTAGLIRETANAVIEMTALAGKIEGVKKAFDKLPNSILLMEELKQRTHGALTELELMQKALQARNFGIPIEQLGKLLEFAAIKSQQTGISIQYLTDSIVTGLGRESIKILDNLQIDIGKLKARMQETGLSMRQVVGDIVNEELKKMGGHLETGETKVNRLKSAWKELGEEVSKSGASGSLIDFLTKALRGWEALFAAQGGNVKGFMQSEAAREEAAKNVIAIRDDATKSLSDEIALTNEELQLRKQVVEELKTEKTLSDEKRSWLQKIGDAVGSFMLSEKVTLEDKIALMEYETEVYTIQLKMLQDLEKSKEMEKELNQGTTVTIESLNKKVEEYNDLIQATSIHDTKRIKHLESLRDQTEAYAKALENLNRAESQNADPVFELTGDLAQEKVDQNKLLEEDTKRTWKEINQAQDQAMDESHDRDVQDLKDKEDWAKKRGRILRQLTDFAIGAAHDVLSAWNESQKGQEETFLASLEKQREAFDENSSRMIKTAGDNERRRLELEITAADERKKLDERIESEQILADQREAAREKKERLRQIAIDTAAGIVRALTVSPGIGRGGLIAAGILAGNAIAQRAIINKFKDGVIDLKGPGNETSDSIPAMLSKRESVMTAAETKSSMSILKNIRARKLNDKIFEKLVVNSPAMQQTDLSPLIKEVRATHQGDLVRKMGVLYEAKEYQKGVKKYIRRASF